MSNKNIVNSRPANPNIIIRGKPKRIAHIALFSLLCENKPFISLYSMTTPKATARITTIPSRRRYNADASIPYSILPYLKSFLITLYKVLSAEFNMSWDWTAYMVYLLCQGKPITDEELREYVRFMWHDQGIILHDSDEEITSHLNFLGKLGYIDYDGKVIVPKEKLEELASLTCYDSYRYRIKLLDIYISGIEESARNFLRKKGRVDMKLPPPPV
jgi:hypothetical protein